MGERLARDMIAVHLTPADPGAVVGSPRYFAVNPPPETSRDLRNHAYYHCRGAGPDTGLRRLEEWWAWILMARLLSTRGSSAGG
jgi:hypothetical protein